MPIQWPDEVDHVLDGDLTAALAYVTPAGGAVVTAVAPIGMRDRAAGTVSFTTSLGFGRKLDRIRANPKVALAYHAREHGFAGGNNRYVLVQGDAKPDTAPDREYLETVVGPRAERFMGPAKRGKLFWDRWLSAYYGDRVPVAIEVRRMIVWPDLACAGSPQVLGEALPPQSTAQKPPAKGTGPRLDCAQALKKLRPLAHDLIGFAGGDGYPVVLPIDLQDAGTDGIDLGCKATMPAGGRRAGILGHSFNDKLIGLAARQHTGWLEVDDDHHHGRYAPHTETGFRAPANKTLLLLANGFMARRGLKQARKTGRT